MVTYDITPEAKATIVVLLEDRLLQVQQDYANALDVGEVTSGYRSLRDAIYQVIRTLEPDRPILPENRR